MVAYFDSRLRLPSHVPKLSDILSNAITRLLRGYAKIKSRDSVLRRWPRQFERPWATPRRQMVSSVWPLPQLQVTNRHATGYIADNYAQFAFVFLSKPNRLFENIAERLADGLDISVLASAIVSGKHGNTAINSQDGMIHLLAHFVHLDRIKNQQKQKHNGFNAVYAMLGIEADRISLAKSRKKPGDPGALSPYVGRQIESLTDQCAIASVLQEFSRSVMIMGPGHQLTFAESHRTHLSPSRASWPDTYCSF